MAKTRASNATSDIELREMTNTSRSTPSSSFLPELNSTPPLPTFQRTNNMHARTESVTTAGSAHLPPPPPPRNPARRMVPRRPANWGPPVNMVGSAHGENRPTNQRMPEGWNSELDHIICIYDQKDFTHAEITHKIKKRCPSMAVHLSSAMIDKRLRQLDQIPEIDYWRRSLRSAAPTAVSENGSPRYAEPRRMGSMVTLDENTPPGHRGLRTRASRGLMQSQSIANMRPLPGLPPHALTTDTREERY
ncbi:hypothetical protein LTR37_004171 [Vermiconidia calcicola]|uniref:Uncharacterized protein n=1 Tax=Vermiconidia calcicola TaxID=1690605 RepID=A0ACC3NMG5_9PEZI|nr:hypothetical protein LTR37_004171 [Vermiconidia calcicola]